MGVSGINGTKSVDAPFDRDAASAAAGVPIVYIVDDDPSCCLALARLLESSGYRVAHYQSPEYAMEKLPQMSRGCILLDVQMPGLTGPELQEQLMQRGCQIPIVFMTGHGDLPTSVRTIKAGAEDFLSKPITKTVLLEVVERALKRFDDEYERNARRQNLQALVSKLTPREEQVFRLVVRGKLNKQIAYHLGASERTIKAHRHNIMSKLGTETVAELVSIAERLEILSAPGAGDRADSSVRR